MGRVSFIISKLQRLSKKSPNWSSARPSVQNSEAIVNRLCCMSILCCLRCFPPYVHSCRNSHSKSGIPPDSVTPWNLILRLSSNSSITILISIFKLYFANSVVYSIKHSYRWTVGYDRWTVGYDLRSYFSGLLGGGLCSDLAIFL